MNKRKRLINFKTIFSVVIVALLVVVVIVLVTMMNKEPVYNDDYFKSDNTKIVLLANSEQPEDDEKNPIKTYMVYYYSGDNITGVKQFYQFKSDEVANSVGKDISADDMDWVKSIVIKGPYIIFELTEDQYEGVTITQVRESVESLEALNGNNGADSDGEKDGGASE
jgi:hypothetical protein